MKKSTSLFAVTLLIASTGFSQSGRSMKNSEVRGSVIDSTSLVPIEYATIALYHLQDSSLVTGGVTDREGTFFIKSVPFGAYLFKVTYLGYNPFTKTNLIIEGKISDLGEFQLVKGGEELEAVTVTGEKLGLETRIDKKIFNADKSIVSKGGNGLDLLRDVPTVEVDENDVILLRGDANVTILIDGRPSAMPVNQFLKQLPASAIEKVEIITNPSAKYDPEGMSGILNIILKKNRQKGFNGNLNTSLGQGEEGGKVRGSTGLNYRTKQLNLFSNYSYSYNHSGSGGLTDRSVLLEESYWDRLITDMQNKSKNHSHYIKTGIDLFVNDQNTLYFSGTYNMGDNFRTSHIDYLKLDEEENIISSSIRDGAGDFINEGFAINGGWQRSLQKEGASLDWDLEYSVNKSRSDATYIQQMDKPNTPALDQVIDNDGKNTILLSRLDIVLPVTDSTIAEFGVHYTGRASNRRFYSESRMGNEHFIPDTSLNNDFEYLQSTLAAYGTYAFQFNKIGLKLGLRAEQTYTTSELVINKEQFINNYFEWFPSVHFSYNLDKAGELALSYSKRINRPTMTMLNPFAYYADPYTLQTGNPFLKPEIIQVMELGYVKYWKNFTLNSSFYYRYIKNKNRRYLDHEGEISALTYKNIGVAHLTGFEFIMSYQPFKILKINATLNIWNYDITDDFLTNGLRMNSTSVSSRINVLLRLKKGWNIQLTGFYRPILEVQQGYILPYFASSLGIQKSIFKQKGNINLRISDLFRTQGFSYRGYNRNNYLFTSDYYWESQMAYLSFSYFFGKKGKGKQRKVKKDNNASDRANLPGM